MELKKVVKKQRTECGKMVAECFLFVFIGVAKELGSGRPHDMMVYLTA